MLGIVFVIRAALAHFIAQLIKSLSLFYILDTFRSCVLCSALADFRVFKRALYLAELENHLHFVNHKACHITSFRFYECVGTVRATGAGSIGHLREQNDML